MKNLIISSILPFLVCGIGFQCCHTNCPKKGANTYYRWTPHWSDDNENFEKSRIEVVQGLPGYSPIARKHTLVAFTPYPAGMNTDRDASWLDVYKLHPWGAETPEISYLRGVPAESAVQQSHLDNRSVEMNFFVDGEVLKESGDYLFIVHWRKGNNCPQNSDSLVARFYHPAAVKMLFVALGRELFGPDADPELKEYSFNNIKQYLSRMPFPSTSLDEFGPQSEYWDIHPGFIPYKDNWTEPGYLDLADPTTFYEIGEELGIRKENYNKTATVKADYVVGLYPNFEIWVYAEGKAVPGVFAVCNIRSSGNVTHELGHLITSASWPSDNYASNKTCGYFYEEDEELFDCIDWAYDTFKAKIIEQPYNIMAWDGVSSWGFFTRHLYEEICIDYAGGCESDYCESFIGLKTIDGQKFLTANSSTGEIQLKSPEGMKIPLWDIDKIVFPGSPTVYYTITWDISNDRTPGPFSMLIGNPSTGELKITDPGYYFYHQSGLLKDWEYLWSIDQVAMNIRIFSYRDYYISWEGSNAKLTKSTDTYSKFLTPALQWKVVKPKPYSGYPD